MQVCVYVYARDARRNRHLRQVERVADWAAALALLAVLTTEQPGACFAIEAYRDAPGDADGE